MLLTGTVGWFSLMVVAVTIALLADHFGLAGQRPRPVTLGRVAGAGLILLGVVLFLGLR